MYSVTSCSERVLGRVHPGSVTTPKADEPAAEEQDDRRHEAFPFGERRARSPEADCAERERAEPAEPERSVTGELDAVPVGEALAVAARQEQGGEQQH